VIRYRSVIPGLSRSPVAAAIALAVAAVTLGVSLQIADGFYEPRALRTLSVALVLTLGGVAMMPRNAVEHHTGWIMRLVLTAGIVLQLAVLFRANPGMYLEPGARLELFAAGIALEGVLVVIGSSGLRQSARWWFPAVLALNLALGVWMLKASPNPKIDVVEVHQTALRALGRGRNPYRITFRNIYGQNSGFYNPEAVAGDRVLFGYPYPPLSLLVAAPGQLIFKDYRYAELAALVAAAALIGFTGASVLSQLTAVLLLTTPRVFFVLEQGWTEPIAVLMLAATTWAMIRRPRWSPWIAGLLTVTKQYLGLAAPLLLKFGSTQRDGWKPFVAVPLLERAGIHGHRHPSADQGAIQDRLAQLRELGCAGRVGRGIFHLGRRNRSGRACVRLDVAAQHGGGLRRRAGARFVCDLRDGLESLRQLLLFRCRCAVLRDCRRPRSRNSSA
jgi:hypothetical protein